MKRGVWDKKRLTGAELRGKTLGVVGLGRIGQEVATRARAFGMDVVAHDPFISEQVAATLGAELVTLDELCARADYITLHIPATPETKNLFDAARLAACKPGLRIINTARGELIDEAALADAIKRGHVAGAGLDVFAVEPPPDQSLTGLPQVDRDAAHRRVDGRSAGAGRPRDRDGGPGLPPRRRHPERRQLPRRAGRGSDPAASLYDARRSAGCAAGRRSRQGGPTASASATTAPR